MQKIIDCFFKVLEYFLIVCMFVMFVMVLTNVILRYGFNSGLVISDEIARMCFFWVIFVGIIIATREQKHLSVDSIQLLLPKASRKICWGIAQMLISICCVTLAYGFISQWDLFYYDSTPIGNISLILVYGVLFVSSVLMAIIYLFNIFRLFLGKVGVEEYSMRPLTKN